MRTRDVADFIRARLDEDEAAANAATPGAWRYNPRRLWHLPPVAFGALQPGEEYVAAGTEESPVCVAGCGPADDPASMADAAHIARYDPARVLADIAAKREIVAWVGDYDADPDGSAWGILGNLAALYADHPDYQQEWAP